MGKLPEEWRIKVMEEERERNEGKRVRMMATEILDWIETQMEDKQVAHALGGLHADPPRSKKSWTGPRGQAWKPYRW